MVLFLFIPFKHTLQLCKQSFHKFPEGILRVKFGKLLHVDQLVGNKRFYAFVLVAVHYGVDVVEVGVID